MVGVLRRKLGPIALAIVLLFMGVGIMNIRVLAEFPSSCQRAAFSLQARLTKSNQTVGQLSRKGVLLQRRTREERGRSRTRR